MSRFLIDVARLPKPIRTSALFSVFFLFRPCAFTLGMIALLSRIRVLLRKAAIKCLSASLICYVDPVPLCLALWPLFRANAVLRTLRPSQPASGRISGRHSLLHFPRRCQRKDGIQTVLDGASPKEQRKWNFWKTKNSLHLN